MEKVQAMNRKALSVIIPAHDEAAVIADSLASLLAQARDDDEIIVVCNGCTDDTAAIARRFEPRVTVLDTPVASKTAALNLGDRHASAFPRIYMDADVTLGEGALDGIARALESGRWLAVSPDPVMDCSGAGWAVKAYYDIWLSLPYCKSGMLGAGVYALSEEGRKRFDRFPDVIADDGYVRALFKEHERGKAEGAHSIVRAPASLHWLIKIKRRSRLGQMELAARFPELASNERKDYRGALLNAFLSPLKWPKLAVYLYVNLMSRLAAKRRLANLARYRWEKDLSSRQGRQGAMSRAAAKKKALLVASHGGHWVQLRRIAPAFDGLDVRYVSTDAGLAGEVHPAPLSVVPDANLDDKPALIGLAVKLFLLVLRQRPDIVISTGAAPGFFALMFGKLLGARTIWVDSVANAEQLSVSGARVKPFADLWLTQWPHLERRGGPLFKGAVL